MKKTITTVDEKAGITQITTVNERWYAKETKDKETGLPSHIFVPSSTWIASYYPKGIGFFKWLADKGWDEAEAIKQEAGERGSKVHQGVEALLGGMEITMRSNMMNPQSEELEEVSLEEYEALMSFVDFWKIEIQDKFKDVEIVAIETTVWGKVLDAEYAGTVDLILKLTNEDDSVEYWVIDHKTSQSVWPSHRIQLLSYGNALELEEEPKLFILQLGYKKNKHKKYKLTQVEDSFELFEAAYKIWKNENDGKKPQQKDYPLSLSLVEKENNKEDNNGDKQKTNEKRGDTAKATAG